MDDTDEQPCGEVPRVRSGGGVQSLGLLSLWRVTLLARAEFPTQSSLNAVIDSFCGGFVTWARSIHLQLLSSP